MRHLDLFSGIGGFALAARWAGFATVGFCEIDPFCRKVLSKHWPEVPIYDDIRNLNIERLQKDGIVGVDLITGGFPCQPFSEAGQSKGAKDDRHLWPEMLRVIAQTRPTWVVGENVFGLVAMELDNCLSDLEAENYAWQTFIIPACAVDAPHRRDRVWIIAHNEEFKWSDTKTEISAEKQSERKAGRCSSKPTLAEQSRQSPYAWQPESRVCRVADGVPDRVDRLKSLGNAVVPQLAFQILRHLADSD